MSDKTEEAFFIEVPTKNTWQKQPDGSIHQILALDGPALNHLLLELERFREREPLVQALIECAFEPDGIATHKAAEKVRDFESCITGGSASDASAADPTGGEPK
jgi:hypothetical protein